MPASILSPVLMMSSSVFLCAMTISAPVLSSDILRHASVRSFTSSLTVTCFFSFPVSLSIIALPLALFMYLFPSLIRNFLISGWKITMIASTPTSRIMSIMALMSLMSNAPTMTRIIYNDTMATKILMAEVPRSHLNNRKMIMPSSRMSRMSATFICRKSKAASSIYLYIIYPRKDSDKYRKF